MMFLNNGRGHIQADPIVGLGASAGVIHKELLGRVLDRLAGKPTTAVRDNKNEVSAIFFYLKADGSAPRRMLYRV